MNKAISWAVVLVAIGGGYIWLSNTPRRPLVIADVVVPEFSPRAAQGEAVFQGTCAACHGVNMVGTANGPPLLSPVYRPASHADYAITRAIKNGVAAHHGRFASMPPQPDIAEADIVPLIAYIREMQRANGIN